MTAPSPSAPAGLAGLAVAPTTGLDSSTTVAKYGLSNTTDTLYVGTLGARLGLAPPPGADPKTWQPTALQVLNAFAAAPADIKAQVQSMLAYAGYYSSTANITYGVVSTDDMSAFAKALNVATSAQSAISDYNTSHPQAPQQPFDFTQNLSTQASIGQTQGIQAAINNRLATVQKAQAAMASQTIDLTHYNTDQVKTIGNQVAEALLGRSLNPDEQAKLYASLGAKNQATLDKATAKANQLDATATEVAKANANLTEAATGQAVGTAQQGTPEPGMTPLQQRQFAAANDEASPYRQITVDTYLDALKQGGDPNNPYGFTPTTWSAYARQAGLGSDASPSPANQQVVARYLALSMFTRYGSWNAVTAGFLAGPSAAAQYAANPSAARWTQTSTTGQTVAGKVNQVAQALATTPNALGPDASLGNVTLGADTGKQTEASISQGLLGGQTSAMPQVVNSEAPVYSPQDIISEQVKEQHPTEYQAHSIAQVFSSFLGLLGGVTAADSSGYGQGGVPG